MAERVVILSDTHLGLPRNPVTDAAQLRPLWQGASALIINGDCAETRDRREQAAAWQHVERLRAMCAEDGVKPTFVAGNHDPDISKQRHLFLANGAIFVTHGDVFHPAVTPWIKKAPLMRATRDAHLSEHDSADRCAIEVRLEAAREATVQHCWSLDQDASGRARRSVLGEYIRRPHAAFKVLHYWAVVPGLAARFAERFCPHAQFVVFGHSHRQGIWRRRERTVINTGCYGFPGKPRAVVLEHGVLSVHAIDRAGDAYRLIDQPLRRFDLPEHHREVDVPPEPALASSA